MELIPSAPEALPFPEGVGPGSSVLGPLALCTPSKNDRVCTYPVGVLATACPEVGQVSPLSILNVVLFPAPFAPRSPKHCREGRSKGQSLNYSNSLDFHDFRAAWGQRSRTRRPQTLDVTWGCRALCGPLRTLETLASEQRNHFSDRRGPVNSCKQRAGGRKCRPAARDCAELPSPQSPKVSLCGPSRVPGATSL